MRTHTAQTAEPRRSSKPAAASIDPAPEVADAVASCRHLSTVATVLTLTEVDEQQLRLLLSAIRAGESALAAMSARVADRAAELADDGHGPPPRELLLGDGTGASGRRAGAEAARAEVLRLLPALRTPLARGLTSTHHIDALARQILPLTPEQRSQLDLEEVIRAAMELPADTFTARLRRLISAIPPLDDEPSPAERKRAASHFRHWFDDDTGMGCFFGQLDPERYEAFTSAIDQHTARLAAEASSKTNKNANLAAEALFDLVTRTADGSRPNTPHISIVLTPDGAETGDGHHVQDDTIRRLLCDATLQRVVHDERGLPLDVGRKHRTATQAQWTAIRSMYTRCAWHLCHRPLRHCQLHHVWEWENGGPTNLDNLVPLCSEHHHRVHEGGWSLTLEPDRVLTITRADGVIEAKTDPPTRQR